MERPERTIPYTAQRRLERIRWPDGPVCPYCGERERFASDQDGAVRYECLSCGAHRGHIRGTTAPEPETKYEVARRQVPRFPR
ncbi:MAG TPA: transposase [Gemmatimonadota bacterium]|nr:transposase [Gemmatimonadota bacterium]